MNSNGKYPHDVDTTADEDQASQEQINVGQLQRLVQLLDKSDIAEIEVKRAHEGMHLVLRKAKAQDGIAGGGYPILDSTTSATSVLATPPAEVRHTITSALVGIFHSWAKPKGKTLISVGDHVKTGQIVGTIQSLNVISEVESTFSGRVVEILVQEGQAVEYGQGLMVIDSTEEA